VKREQTTGSQEATAGRVHRKIITRHAEDAAFYWARRMDGALASQHDLHSLGRFEFLLQANLEGLRVAQYESSHLDARGHLLTPGSAGWDATFRRVQLWKTADETFVAAVLALEDAGAAQPTADDTSGASVRPLALLEEVACDQFDDAAGSDVPPMALGLASAAGWLPWDVVRTPVLAWARSTEALLRRCALSALALQRLPADGALARWLNDTHPMVRARALQAVGELGQTDLAGDLVSALEAPADNDPWGCRAAAATSLCLLGRAHGRSDVAAGIAAAWAGSPAPQAATQFLAAWAQTAPASQLQTVVEPALQQRENWRLALAAMRFSGDERWLDVLIQMMEHQSGVEPVARFFTEPASNLARHAADVFAHISGARIGEQLWRQAPEPDQESDAEAAAEDTASDPRIPAARKQDPDDGLLWPDVDAVKQWWSAHRSGFAPGGAHQGRYLAGLPLQPGSASQVLVDPSATQLQRHHAALYLRCASHTAQLFDVRAPLPAQRARAHALGLVLP